MNLGILVLTLLVQAGMIFSLGGFNTMPIQNISNTPGTVSNPTSLVSVSNKHQGKPAPGDPIRAIRIQYKNYANRNNEVKAIQSNINSVNTNLVALSAGRVEWAYFKWNGHPDLTSNDVKDSGVDMLAEDSALFGPNAHIDAVIDVLSPNYIIAHPDAASVNSLGKRSTLLVGTMEMVQGNYGKLLLEMVSYISANYPNVDSISITELSYRMDGYGPQEKASYLAFSGAKDWPRQANGSINIDDKSIGDWRSQLISGYMDQLAAAAHAHGKQLFLDVSMDQKDLARETNENGTNYTLMLQHIDKLVVWGYYYLEGYSPDFLQQAGQFLQKYGNDHVIMSIGMWGPNGSVLPPDLMIKGIQDSVKGGLPNIWITPSIMMNAKHWKALQNIWGNQGTNS